MSLVTSKRARRTGKVLSAVIGLAMVLSLGAPGASAQTVSQLQAQIAALLAQINMLQSQLSSLQGGGSGSGVACTFTRSLFLGVSGADVQCLQRYLNSAGFQVAASGAGSPGNESQYFGPLTQSAVAAWQAANGVSPAAGYFGPLSQARYAALNAGSPGTPGTPSGPLSGGAGSISDADFMSGLNNEEVGEDENDVEVAGLTIEADEGSDIELTAVTLDFDYADTGADTDLDDYADEVSVWFEGDEVARLDADEFDDNNGFNRTVALDSGAIIRAGDTAELVVAVSGVANLDSANAGENWNVAFEGIRFRDAQGAVITDTSTGDIEVGNDDTTTDAAERQFSFETFATASDLELKISNGDDSVNDAHVINIDDTNDTDNVDIFSFEVEVEGDSDVMIQDLVVEFVVTGTASDLNDIVSAIRLKMDGSEVGNENATDDETVTFDDIDVDLNAGQTYDFLVAVDFLATSTNTFDEGDTILAKITSTERDLWDVEDENGDDVADADKTGSATSEAHAVYDAAFNATLVSTDADVTVGDAQASESDRATFTIVWDVTAFDSDIYIGSSTNATTSATATAEDGAGYHINDSVAQSQNATSTATLTCSSCDTSGGAFVVDEGDTERFTLTVNLQAPSDDFFEVGLASIGWATDASADANVFNFNLDEFDAGPVFIQAR